MINVIYSLFVSLLPFLLIGSLYGMQRDFVVVEESAASRTRLTNTPDGARAAPVSGNLPEDFRIGVGDILTVSVMGVSDLEKTVEVSSSGNIRLPYLTEVHVEGLTVHELEKRLTTLFDAAIVKNPQVSVFVKEYQSQSITIIGEVNKPGIYQSRSKLSLINALSKAGWVTSNAGNAIYVQRANKPNLNRTRTAPSGPGESKVITVAFKDLINAGDGEANILVQGGDIVRVSKKEDDKLLYLIGGINKPGAYTASQGPNLLEAIAVAGGLSPSAKRRKITISRVNPDGQRTRLEANLEEILKGKNENLVLQEKDIVFVPDRNMKSLKGDLINSILVPGSLLPSLVYLLSR
ncbi:MAG: polysaccharide biosynthesis/export family protein [Acidobacteria bacterium]|nr:polysaccharide biosynthesis/export family protein [Acidobacteriota bacterium]MBI3655105.1 polysaccharide biosynthesis/export family protein [Acidobacteriota bacterium]